MIFLNSLKCLNPLSTGRSVQTKWMVGGLLATLRLNPLSTGRSVQTLPSFFPFVKQYFTEVKYFKLCIRKVDVSTVFDLKN